VAAFVHQCPAIASTRVGAAPSQGGLTVRLLDDLVRPLQQRLRDRQTECFGGLQIDDQLELRPLYGQVGGLRTF